MKKVILITGASSGMGKETAKKLIQEGHIVYTVARRIDQMQDLMEMGAHPIKMNVTVEADIDNVVNTILKEQGRLTCFGTMQVMAYMARWRTCLWTRPATSSR